MPVVPSFLILQLGQSGSPIKTLMFPALPSSAIDKATFSSLLVLAPGVQSRALAAIPHSRDWLSVVPYHQLGLHFLDQEFCLCAQYWLGISACSGTSSCPVCSSPSDGTGDHQVGCCGNRDLICCHNSLHDVLFAAAQSASLAPQKEMPSLIPGSSARPADVFLPQWSGVAVDLWPWTSQSSLRRH